MGYSETVDIRFSLSQIQEFERSVEGLRGQTVSLQRNMAESNRAAEDYLSSVLAWLDDCLEKNEVDYQNAKNFEQALEKAVWNTETELKKRETQCNRLYELKRDAYNHYDAVKSKARADSPAATNAVEAAWNAYKKAEDRYNDAYSEKESCQSRLDSLKKAQGDLFWIQDKIHNDCIMLNEEKGTYSMLMRDLAHAYSKFEKSSQKAFNTIERILECTKTAYKYASRAAARIGEMNGIDVNAGNEIEFTSIAAVYRNADYMESLNERCKDLERKMKGAVAEYNELIIDNIMKRTDVMMREVSQTMARNLQTNAQKASLMKELAQDLQKYYDVPVK